MYWNSSLEWNPFDGLRTLQREMNRLFDGYETGRGVSRFPALNLWSNGEQALVTAELPGVDPKSIDTTVMKDQLTIQGERRADEPVEGLVCHRAERGHGRFVRTVRLPFEVEHDQVKARYEKGVLTITLPRAEATKPKRIEIGNK